MSSYQFQVKQFGWVSTPSFRQQNEQWQARQASLSDAMSAGSDAADAFASAASDLGSGLNFIAAQRAATRLNIPTSGSSGSTSNSASNSRTSSTSSGNSSSQTLDLGSLLDTSA